MNVWLQPVANINGNKELISWRSEGFAILRTLRAENLPIGFRTETHATVAFLAVPPMVYPVKEAEAIHILPRKGILRDVRIGIQSCA